MNTRFLLNNAPLISLILLLISCTNSSREQDQTAETKASLSLESAVDDTALFKTENLLVRRLSENVYEHTSFLDTKDFGRVPCNGMLVVNGGEAVVCDTPANAESTGELISYITQELNSEIKAVVAT